MRRRVVLVEDRVVQSDVGLSEPATRERQAASEIDGVPVAGHFRNLDPAGERTTCLHGIDDGTVVVAVSADLARAGDRGRRSPAAEGQTPRQATCARREWSAQLGEGRDDRQREQQAEPGRVRSHRRRQDERRDNQQQSRALAPMRSDRHRAGTTARTTASAMTDRRSRRS